MSGNDVTTLFSRAEHAFAAGQLDAARDYLKAVRRAAGDHPAIFHLLALVEKNSGDAQAARTAFDRALELDPANPEIAANAGNFHRGQGDHERALQCYDRALAAAPGNLSALLGRASCLASLERFEQAREAFRKAAALAPVDHRPWSGLGALERQAGNLAAAAEAFDQSLARSPSATVPLHGRARVALERGEEDARDRFVELERCLPDDPNAALGAAEALVPVDQARAIAALEAVARRFPDWPDPQSALARLRWERGEQQGFAAGLEAAVDDRPFNQAMWSALVETYGGIDRHRDAADAAGRAYSALGLDLFRLLEASHASEAGDMERADAVFAELRGASGTSLAEARHLLKRGEVERSEALLDVARAASPDDIAAWAWTGIVWRLKDDPRADWLYQVDRLVGVGAMAATAAEIEDIAAHMASLHHAASFPIGQSLRGGTQTRGRLFDRADPKAQRLRELLAALVEAHWSNLPDEDPSHPLLRHRARAPRFAGSWSVRLTDAGYHVAHFHPRGLLSSACYLRLPEPRQGQEGWLELGRPPADLGLDLPPLVRIEPKMGALALFPSYLFHGTVPFPKGERLTVAFDVAV